jgi:hypothetical protein
MTRVSFCQQTSIREFTPIEKEQNEELYYAPVDYIRFQLEEKQRWERAIEKRLRKMESQSEERQLMLQLQELQQQRKELEQQREAATPQEGVPQVAPFRSASAA